MSRQGFFFSGCPRLENSGKLVGPQESQNEGKNNVLGIVLKFLEKSLKKAETKGKLRKVHSSKEFILFN